MTLSVTIYFPAHCSHTGSPDWGDVPQGRLWVESRPLRLRPCAVLQSCGPVPFAVTSSSDSLITTQQQNIVRTCPSDSVKGRDLHVEGTPGEVHHRTLRRFFRTQQAQSLYLFTKTRQYELVFPSLAYIYAIFQPANISPR